MYLTLKHLHLFTVALSLGLFSARWLGSLAQANWVRWKPVRIIPHINDTLLLASGIALMVVSAQYPWIATWLAVKLVLVIAYIGIGYGALKCTAWSGRLGLGLSALSLAGGAVYLAISKTLPGLS